MTSPRSSGLANNAAINPDGGIVITPQGGMLVGGRSVLMLGSDGKSIIGPAGPMPIFPVILKVDANLIRTAVGTAADATDVTMSSFTLPGGFLGNNGQLIVVAGFNKTATTQNSNMSLWIGGQTINSPPILAANTRAGAFLIASMAGASGTVEGLNLGLNPFSQATGATISRAIDTTVDQEVLVTLNWAAAVTPGDTCRIMSLLVLGFPGTV